MRSRADAVMVGASTVGVDDPLLTVRDHEGIPGSRRPLRVVLAGDSLPDPASHVLDTHLGPATVLAPEGTQADLGILDESDVAVLTYGRSAGLRGALEALGGNGVTDLLVEPGARLFAALHAEGLIDQLVTVVGGGVAGPGGLGLGSALAASQSSLTELGLTAVKSVVVDGDAVTVWTPSDEGR
jgi:diaminohydroxyphosphoribosylaminopyrimidine deaminase/5-amino-6-(5-phosphoribosylamino)uracil reductase